MYALPIFSSGCVVKVQETEPYKRTVSTAARKKFLFRLSGRLYKLYIKYIYYTCYIYAIIFQVKKNCEIIELLHLIVSNLFLFFHFCPLSETNHKKKKFEMWCTYMFSKFLLVHFSFPLYNDDGKYF